MQKTSKPPQKLKKKAVKNTKPLFSTYKFINFAAFWKSLHTKSCIKKNRIQ